MADFLLTGAGGQDALIFTSLLTEAGISYERFARNLAGAERAERLIPSVPCRVLDITSKDELGNAIQFCRPKYIVNFAGNSSVAKSWESPSYSVASNFLGVANLFESLLETGIDAVPIIFGSSEVWARGVEGGDNQISGASPYGIAKAAAWQLSAIFEKHMGLSSLRLLTFNHESPLRRFDFFSSSLARQVASVRRGESKLVAIRDGDSEKDWGWAPEFMRLVLTLILDGKTGEYEIGSGHLQSTGDLARAALSHAGLGNDILYIEPKMRPNDRNHRASQNKRLLAEGYPPPQITGKAMIEKMVDFEMSVSDNREDSLKDWLARIFQ